MLESETIFSAIIGGIAGILGGLVVIIGNHFLEKFKQNWDSRTRKKQRAEKQLEEFYGPLRFLGEMLNFIKNNRNDISDEYNLKQIEHQERHKNSNPKA